MGLLQVQIWNTSETISLFSTNNIKIVVKIQNQQVKRNGGVKITRKVIKDNGAHNKVYKLISVKILRKNFSVKNKKTSYYNDFHLLFYVQRVSTSWKWNST